MIMIFTADVSNLRRKFVHHLKDSYVNQSSIDAWPSEKMNFYRQTQFLKVARRLNTSPKIAYIDPVFMLSDQWGKSELRSDNW